MDRKHILLKSAIDALEIAGLDGIGQRNRDSQLYRFFRFIQVCIQPVRQLVVTVNAQTPEHKIISPYVEKEYDQEQYGKDLFHRKDDIPILQKNSDEFKCV